MTAFVLTGLLALPAAYLALVAAYLFLLAAASWRFQPRRDPEAPPLRIALVIPAHNESAHIGGILDSAQALEYPAERRGIIVIADNCTDDTAERARAAGAQVLERHAPTQRGKGQALDWLIQTHGELLGAYDAVALVDADMRIHPDFLRELSASFNAGPDILVVQASNAVSNPGASWRTAIGFAAFSVINHLRPAGRCRLGGTAELKGSGMAFRTPTLRHYGWPAHSLTEDIEFSKTLLLDGILVHYNPHARVESGLPLNRAQADIQQRRWEGGKARLFRDALPRFARKALTGQWRYIDALLDLLVPPLSLYAALLAAALLLSLLAHPAITAILAASAAALAFTVASALLQRRAPAAVWLRLAAAPLFVAWKIPLQARALLARDAGGWQRTPRDEEL